MTCPRCGQALVVAAGPCLECGADLPAPRSTTAELEVAALPPSAATTLTRLLKDLVAEPPEVVEAAVAQRSRLVLAGSLTDSQWQRLGEWIAALGARQERRNVSATGTELGIGFDLSLGGGVKLAVTAVTGGVAWWLGVSLVPLAAVLVMGALLARAVSVLPRALTLLPTVGPEKLEIVDPALAGDLARARRQVTNAAVIDALRNMMHKAVGVLALLRSNGDHVLDRELQALDRRLHQLLRHALRIATRVDRLGQVEPASPTPGSESPRSSQVAAAMGECVATLEALAAGLDHVQTTMIDLRSAEARQALTAGPLKELWDLEARLEGAAVVAQL